MNTQRSCRGRNDLTVGDRNLDAAVLEFTLLGVIACNWLLRAPTGTGHALSRNAHSNESVFNRGRTILGQFLIGCRVTSVVGVTLHRNHDCRIGFEDGRKLRELVVGGRSERCGIGFKGHSVKSERLSSWSIAIQESDERIGEPARRNLNGPSARELNRTQCGGSSSRGIGRILSGVPRCVGRCPSSISYILRSFSRATTRQPK